MKELGMLVVTKGFNRGDIYKLGARNLTAGRDTGNLIQLVDREVSRRHFLIRSTAEGYTLMDMNSANGTHINGKLVTMATLHFNDVIRAGETYLKLVEHLDAVDDAVLGAKVTDPRIAGARTAYSDKPFDYSQLTPTQPAPAAPPPEAAARTLRADPAIIDTADLDRKQVTEMDRIFAAMKASPDYLDTAVQTISRFICPDRGVLLQLVQGQKLQSKKVHLHEHLAAQYRDVPPALTVVKAAMKQGRWVIDNRIEAPAGKVLPRSAMAAPVMAGAQAIGAVYIDSFASSYKQYMEFDAEMLEKVARVLALRWSQ